MDKKRFFSAVFSNLLPIVGVLFWGWSVFSLLLAYWLENIAIGFFQVLKLRRVTSNYPVNEKNKMIEGPLRPVKSFEKIFAQVFFSLHYSLFCGGHFVFLYFFAKIVGDPIEFTPLILLSGIPFFITHGKNYFDTYIGKKEYQATPLAKLFFAPYRRIITLHIIIVIGAAPILLAANFIPKITVLLIVFKMLLDLRGKEESNDLIWKTAYNLPLK